MDTGFSTQQITQMLGLSPAQVRAYVRAGLLCPQRGHAGELRFSFQDLLLLRTAEGLVTDRLPPRRVRDALRKLRRRLPTERPLTGVSLGSDGGHVVVRDGQTAWRADSGQGLLSFNPKPTPTPKPTSTSLPMPTPTGAGATHQAAASDVTSIAELQRRAADAANINVPASRGAANTNDGEQRRPDVGAAVKGGVGPEPRTNGQQRAGGDPSEVEAGMYSGVNSGVNGPSVDDFYQLGCSLEDDAPEAARVAYLNVLKLEPNHADSHVNLGRLMHEAGDLEFAEEHYRAALAVRPADATAFFNLGVVLEDGGRPEAAVENYEAALRVDPTHADAHFNAARLHDLAGRYEAALRHLRAYRNLTSG